MALQVQNIRRVFKFKKDGKDVPLTDPNHELSPAEVMKFYSANYAELTNGVIEGPVTVKDTAVYTMTTKAGKLG